MAMVLIRGDEEVMRNSVEELYIYILIYIYI